MIGGIRSCRGKGERGGGEEGRGHRERGEGAEERRGERG